MKDNFSKTLKFVFAVHLALVFVLCIQHLFAREKTKTKMVVRTIHTQTQAVAVSPVKAKPIAIPYKKTSPVTAQKQIPIKTGSLAKNTAPSKKTSEIILPKEIPPIKADEIPVAKDPVLETPSYGEILTAYLQNSLDLPEYGEVKVELEIDCFGHLVRFEILEEKSKKNGEFLKKRLPELVLPCFNERGKLHETAVFTITFKNSSSPFL